MGTINETGHAKNLANFNTLISFVTAYGANYNPSRATIQLPNLIIKAAEAQATMDTLNATLPLLNQAMAARAMAFEPLQKLGTKLLNALKATEASALIIGNLSTLNKKLSGRRVGHKLKEEEIIANQAKGLSVVQVSTSQQSFDTMLDTFDKIVKLLATIPEYAPNETELQVATLKLQYTALQNHNNLVADGNTKVSNARLNRNEIMYHEETGLKATALDVKSYVRSLYGVSSPKYKQVSTILFTGFKP